jgi:hypothetical protein
MAIFIIAPPALRQITPLVCPVVTTEVIERLSCAWPFSIVAHWSFALSVAFPLGSKQRVQIWSEMTLNEKNRKMEIELQLTSSSKRMSNRSCMAERLPCGLIGLESTIDYNLYLIELDKESETEFMGEVRINIIVHSASADF